MIICPQCGSTDLQKGTVSYPGCITDMDRYGESQAWDHDGYQCKVCKCKFTIWDGNDDFVEVIEGDFDALSMKIDQMQAGEKINCWKGKNVKR